MKRDNEEKEIYKKHININLPAKVWESPAKQDKFLFKNYLNIVKFKENHHKNVQNKNFHQACG